jgi:hypothetical protein
MKTARGKLRVVGAPADSGTGRESAVGTGDCARGAVVDDIAPADRVIRGVDVGAPADEALGRPLQHKPCWG